MKTWNFSCDSRGISLITHEGYWWACIIEELLWRAHAICDKLPKWDISYSVALGEQTVKGLWCRNVCSRAHLSRNIAPKPVSGKLLDRQTIYSLVNSDLELKQIYQTWMEIYAE